MFNKERAIVVLDKLAEWALYILIFVLPFSKSLIEIMIVAAIVTVGLKKAIKREKLFKNTPINICLYIFIAASLFSFFNTQYFPLSMKALFSKLLKFAVLFLLTQEVLNDRVKIKNFLTMGLLSCVIVLIDAFIQYYVTHMDLFRSYPPFQFSLPNITTRISVEFPYFGGLLGFPTASFPYPNDFSAWIIVVIFPIAAFMFYKKCGLSGKVVLSVLALCLFYFLMLTKTKGAWIGFIIACALVPVLVKVHWKKILTVVLVVACMVPFVINKKMMPYIVANAGISERNIIWNSGWNIFKQHPVIGNGINTFFVEYMRVRDDEWKNKKGSYAHNCYLQMASDTGIVGLSAFLGFIFALLYGATTFIKNKKDDFYYLLQLGLVLGLIAYLIHSFVDTNLYSLNLAALFWITAGLSAAITNTRGAQ